MANTNIIVYSNIKIDWYTSSLEAHLHRIRELNAIHNEFLSGIWDSKIKYRSSFDKNLNDLQPKYYQERGKWVDFIFITDHFDTEINKLVCFSTASLYHDKMRLILLFFWRDIINKLNDNTIFKLQLKLNLSYPIESKDKTEASLKYNKEVKISRDINKTYSFNSTDSVYKGTPTIRSIGSVKIFKKNNFTEALSYFKASIDFVIDNYLTFSVSNVILTYNICHDDSILKTLNISTQNFNSLEQNHKNNFIEAKSKLKLNDKNLPLTTDLFLWGNLQITKGNYPYQFNNKETKILIISENINSNFSYNYIVSIKAINLAGKKVILQKISVTDKSFKEIYLSFMDIVYNTSNPCSFVRIINDSLYVYDNSIKKLSLNRKITKYFNTLKKCKRFTYNFITMDLETKNIKGNLIPYCVSIFDGKKAYSFYIDEFKSSDEMLKASIKFILKRKYNKYRVYLHNFSYFDGIFLMKALSNIVKSNNIKPIIRDGRIINLKLEFYSKTRKKYYVEFRDSYLLLTSSLEKLGKTFALNDGKLEIKLPFPYKFVNKPNIGYNYIGNVPNFLYYDKINQTEYNNLILNMKSEGKDLSKWDLKKETISYCEQDCKTLYYSILNFGKLIYIKFGVDISKTPTVSSLAFRIYRVKYLSKDNCIPILHDSIYEFIYQSYYGGAVDSYIPFGENIKGYDVNSLYPSSMFNSPMPVGSPYYFEGDLDYFDKINFNYPTDITLNKNKKIKTIYSHLNEIFNLYSIKDFEKKLIVFLNLNQDKSVLCDNCKLPYGFFEVDLKTPPKDTWNQPILLKKHKIGNGGVRTIAPVGSWKGVYFSQELYNAINKNPQHKFKTHRGFLFRQGYLFKSYVDILFNLRLKNPPKSPLNVISKLLLNSLYGRFGMSPDRPNHIILGDTINKDKIFINNEVTNIVDFGNEKELYSYVPKKVNDREILDLLKNDAGYSNMLINVAISSSITGYSRILMSLFKNNPKIKLYYSDTDSAFIEGNLEDIYPELVGTRLGQLKPEYEFKEVVFLVPKVYGDKSQGGENIIKAKGVKL